LILKNMISRSSIGQETLPGSVDMRTFGVIGYADSVTKVRDYSLGSKGTEMASVSHHNGSETATLGLLHEPKGNSIHAAGILCTVCSAFSHKKVVDQAEEQGDHGSSVSQAS